MKIYIIVLLGLISINGDAQKVVIDATSIQQVLKNSATMMVPESTTKVLFQDSEEEQEVTKKKMLAIQTALTVYQRSLENVEAFGTDSRNVKVITRLLVQDLKQFYIVMQEVIDNPESTVASTNMMGYLLLELSQCADYCIGIVAGNSISIPEFNFTVGNRHDGHNLLDAKDRIDMANHLIISLRRMYNILTQIRIQLAYSKNWGQIFQEVLPFQHYMITDSKYIIDDIITSFDK